MKTLIMTQSLENCSEGSSSGKEKWKRMFLKRIQHKKSRFNSKHQESRYCWDLPEQSL